MNHMVLHNKVMEEYGVGYGTEREKHNAILLPKDPCDFIDCTPEENYENFKGIVDGGRFIYADVANSVPLEDGYKIDVKNQWLVSLLQGMDNEYINDDESIFRMEKLAVGKPVYSFTDTFNQSPIGIVTEALAWKPYAFSDTIFLSVIASFQGDAFAESLRQQFDKDNMAFILGYRYKCNQRICCNCGSIFNMGDEIIVTPECNHKSAFVTKVLDIVDFKLIWVEKNKVYEHEIAP